MPLWDTRKTRKEISVQITKEMDILQKGLKASMANFKLMYQEPVIVNLSRN